MPRLHRASDVDIFPVLAIALPNEAFDIVMKQEQNRKRDVHAAEHIELKQQRKQHRQKWIGNDDRHTQTSKRPIYIVLLGRLETITIMRDVKRVTR